jgi:hypothetical protein
LWIKGKHWKLPWQFIPSDIAGVVKRIKRVSRREKERGETVRRLFILICVCMWAGADANKVRRAGIERKRRFF